MDIKKLAVGSPALLGMRQYRRWHLRWGATDEEMARPMPGDEICAKPNFNFTRAITIEARPHEIWPWLVQIGFGRAGWYSYDILDNLGHHSAERIIPELQNLEVGDYVPMGPGKPNDKTSMRVRDFEVDKWLLWTNYSGSWVWALEPIDGERTRLVTRGRIRYSWKKPILLLELVLMEIGDPFMMRKLLLNVKKRAERHARRRRTEEAAMAMASEWRPGLRGVAFMRH